MLLLFVLYKRELVERRVVVGGTDVSQITLA